MNQEKSSVLGHLVEITGEYFIAKLKPDSEGLSSDKMIGMDKVRIGQVGSYLLVTQSETKILCMVESMWTETSERGYDIHKLRLTPLGQFSRDGGFERGINFVEAVMTACQHAFINFVPIWLYEPMKGFCMEQLGEQYGDLEGFEGHIGQMAIRIVHHYLMGGWGMEDTEEASVLLADQVSL